ncbi:response regulator [Iningainema tapete]|uniref:Response regulator n=1 Tax=Iningainema tapete BLCC-T55 TaxID=2748662 RepID=A0A8J7C9B6_9CYAN|nr:response regulator [Iningainema tapete]MBD2777929.1 response regulator [Iningainema tapete BLCC-T55]
MNSLEIFNGLRLLVVDDNVDSLELITAIFETLNTQVMTATLAHNVLTMITEFQPHVLISDISMPDEDGYSLIRKIRAHKDPQVQKIPAIALTGIAYQTSLTQAIDAGFTTYLTKPFDPDNLITVVANLAQNTICNQLTPAS